MDAQNTIKLPESKFIQLPECEGELPELHTIVTYKGRDYSYEGCDTKQKHAKKREVFLVKIEENAKKSAQLPKSHKKSAINNEKTAQEVKRESAGTVSNAKARGKQEILEFKAAGGNLSITTKGSDLGVKIASELLYGSNESMPKAGEASSSSSSAAVEVVRQEPHELYAKYLQELSSDTSQAVPERNFKAYRQNCVRHHPPIAIFSKLDSLIKNIFFSEKLDSVQVLVPLKVLETGRKGSPRICEKNVLEIGLNEDGKAIHVFLREVKNQEEYDKYRELKGKPLKTISEAKLKIKKENAIIQVTRSKIERAEKNKLHLFSFDLDKIPRQWTLYQKNP